MENYFSRFAKPIHIYLGIFLGAAFLLFSFSSRLVPKMGGDRGIFISVGERLLAGDKLYSGVYDNKDPLFYYAVAAQRFLGPPAEYLFELGVISLSGLCCYLMGLQLNLPRSTSALLGLVVVPLIVTGPFFWPGSTEMPGIALSLCSCAMVTTHRVRLAGIFAGLVFFTKLIYAPLPIVFFVAYTLANGESSPKKIADAKGFMVSTALTSLAIISLLLYRCELSPYFNTQISNFYYARGLLVESSGFIDSLFNHLDSTLFFDKHGIGFFIAMVLTIALVVFLIKGKSLRTLNAFVIATVSVSFVSIGILSLTGIWNGHQAIMYVSACLVSLCLFVSVFRYGFNRWVIWVCGVYASIFLSGSMSLVSYLSDPRELIIRTNSLKTLSHESAALIRETDGVSAQYARIGLNDDEGHAYGLQNYDLVCADFHQYSSYGSERLSKILECAAKAEYIIVSENITKWGEAPKWFPPHANMYKLKKIKNRYVEEVEGLLLNKFYCVQIDRSKARLCKQKNIN